MRMRIFVVLVVWGLLFVRPVPAQTANQGGRRIVLKVEPRYPEIARKMNIQGTVKVTAVVTPEGTVRSVKAVGGSPLLVQASQTAIQEWKFAPAASESEELIELHFHP